MAKRSGQPGRKPRQLQRKLPEQAQEKRQDVALVFDRTDDRQGFHVLRRRGEDQPIEVGTIRPLREGEPIDGEVVSLKPREGAPFLCDVKVEVDARRPTTAGPAQVASEAYRTGWDAIFSGRPANGAKPN